MRVGKNVRAGECVCGRMCAQVASGAVDRSVAAGGVEWKGTGVQASVIEVA